VVGRTTPPTAEERRRLSILSEVGCLCCMIDGWWESAEIHHPTEGFHRKGHRHSYPICPWHHRAVPPPHVCVDFGPSLARAPAQYCERYGTEAELVQIADAVVRIVEQARRRSEWISDDKMRRIVQCLHREVVRRQPHEVETLRRYCV
jgi:hypothetical protein